MGQLTYSRHGVMLMTVSTIEGYEVEYIGLVTGQSVVGVNIFSDVFAYFTDILGGRSRSYEHPLNDAMDAALNDMAMGAANSKADAVLGLELDTSQVGRGMLMCSATGTAVRLRPTRF